MTFSPLRQSVILRADATLKRKTLLPAVLTDAEAWMEKEDLLANFKSQNYLGYSKATAF